MSSKVNKDIAKFNALRIASTILNNVIIDDEVGAFLEREDLSEFVPLIEKELDNLISSIENRAKNLNGKYQQKIPDFAQSSIEDNVVENAYESL